ncbi:MAG: hypothetical protein Tp1100SUR639781_3 [Prokaryotic dsDNA virus sp.]|jgi:hypothetical protein|nr:MAG: hypothetical protein Tp1100SUR639781_3 [Prokaryotic dsDNA virus sp.]|tara:strand:- start:14070 stop:14576 length:507 start_codon:yes stop_codon:yes gene_type:complete
MKWSTVIIVLGLAWLMLYVTDSFGADTTIRYKDQPPPSAIAPSLSIGSGSDVCIVVRTGAIGTGIFSGSFATHVIDKNCERIKLSRSLAQLGLKVSATSILCQDDRVFTAMLAAGSPCPIDGLVGKEAKNKYLELGIIDENNNIVGSRDALRINISQPRRHDYGQPTQ